MATVLIVDDQRETGHLLSKILQYLGHRGVHVPSGEDALNYVRSSTPDCVLLDYMMPGMDGLEVLRAMRSDPRTKAIPIIMFSANSDPKVVDLAMKAGANDFWVKATVAIGDMEQRLTHWLKESGGAHN